jgi:hypothetical protein
VAAAVITAAEVAAAVASPPVAALLAVAGAAAVRDTLNLLPREFRCGEIGREPPAMGLSFLAGSEGTSEEVGSGGTAAPILGVLTPDLERKDVLLASDPKVFFTTQDR